jgi:hypothetical protein
MRISESKLKKVVRRLIEMIENPDTSCVPGDAVLDKISDEIKEKSKSEREKAMREILQSLYIKTNKHYTSMLANLYRSGTPNPQLQKINPSEEGTKAVESVRDKAIAEFKSQTSKGEKFIPPPPSGPAPVAFESRRLADLLFGDLLKEDVNFYLRYCDASLAKEAVEMGVEFIKLDGEEAFKEIVDVALQGAKAGYGV